MRPLPQPIGSVVRPDGLTVLKWSHRVELVPSGWAGHRDVTKAKCADCEWQGRYPSREHARGVADEHMIRTHATGAEFCGTAPHNGAARPRSKCDGCAAIKRKAARTP